MVSTGDPATTVATLRQALDVISGLGQERSQLEARVKELRDRDNVLPALMSRGPENTEAVFQAQLTQYDPLSAAVDTNVTRQAEILGVITQSYYSFKAAYDVDGWRQQCDVAFRALPLPAPLPALPPAMLRLLLPCLLACLVACE